MKGIKLFSYFNLNIKFYIRFKLWTHLVFLKHICYVYFHCQFPFPTRQMLLSKSISTDLSSTLKTGRRRYRVQFPVRLSTFGVLRGFLRNPLKRGLGLFRKTHMVGTFPADPGFSCRQLAFIPLPNRPTFENKKILSTWHHVAWLHHICMN